jgi:hypothetical protein
MGMVTTGAVTGKVVPETTMMVLPGGGLVVRKEVTGTKEEVDVREIMMVETRVACGVVSLVG